MNNILEIRKFIPSTICEKIILYFDNSNKLVDAQITDPSNPVDKDIRNCKTRVISQDINSFGERLVLNYIKSKVKESVKVYQKKYPHASMSEIQEVSFLKYEKNNHKSGYLYHVDQGASVPKRSLSISICLNNEFQGGEFMFDINGEKLNYPQNVGDLIIFPSNFMFPHQVNKIKSGTRFALVTWVC